jgi:hypothetical protein
MLAGSILNAERVEPNGSASLPLAGEAHGMSSPDRIRDILGCADENEMRISQRTGFRPASQFSAVRLPMSEEG